MGKPQGQGRVCYTAINGVLATGSAPVISLPTRSLPSLLRASPRDPEFERDWRNSEYERTVTKDGHASADTVL
ncbi:hypothetical protein XACJK48_4540002 [Xanthomonas citri pv. citri]|nr:hypothetical protein XACJK48_4540002 [Xanthomonas citri pv. citri]